MSGANEEKIIRQYIEAYNDFDINSMLALLHPDIKFRNVSNGEMNAQTSGKSEFEALARESATLFKTRSQSIRSLHIREDKAIAEIKFIAVLAKDIPNGLKAGEKLELEGKSEFLFKDGLIWSVIDES
jgi:hypothetical protein